MSTDKSENASSAQTVSLQLKFHRRNLLVKKKKGVHKLKILNEERN